jgi:hypothetical protein
VIEVPGGRVSPQDASASSNLVAIPSHITLFSSVLLDGRKIGSFESTRQVREGRVITAQTLDLSIERAGIAVASGMHLPQKIGWRELFVIGAIAAIGFSVGLFMANDPSVYTGRWLDVSLSGAAKVVAHDGGEAVRAMLACKGRRRATPAFGWPENHRSSADAGRPRACQFERDVLLDDTRQVVHLPLPECP